jgi:hypothetical protein
MIEMVLQEKITMVVQQDICEHRFRDNSIDVTERLLERYILGRDDVSK